MALISPMNRAAIIVRDLGQSLAFWRDGLGLTVYRDGTVDATHPSFHRLLGLTPAPARYVILQASELLIGRVGLFEVADTAGPGDVTRTDPGRVNRGEVVLVFDCVDVHAAHGLAVERGLPVISPPQRFDLPELGVHNWEMTLRDPNGVGVNLIQRLSAPDHA